MTVETVSGQVSIVANALTRLATCLCAQIIADGSPSPCFCGVVPGEGFDPGLMDCDETDGSCGVAFVQMNSSYPSSTVGVIDQTPGNCAQAIGIDLTVAIVRCFPLEVDGSVPGPDVLLEVAQQQMLDMESMRRAISCCDWLPNKDVLVGQYSPQGPEGGIIGGNFQVFAQVFG